MKTTNQYRQGDVLIVTSEVPSLAEKQNIKEKLILAEGEATGHTHAIYDLDSASLFVNAEKSKSYLKTRKPTELMHEEHDKINLPIGEYEIIRQREYAPGSIKTVAD